MPPRKGDRLIDLTGQTFGLLTVRSFAGYKLRGGRERACWLCDCECGKTIVTFGEDLKQNTKSCGHLQRETRAKNGSKRHIDLVGKHIFEWFVKERVEDRISKSGIHAVQYLCVCSCGVERIVLAATLLAGQSHNCGHDRQDKIAKVLTKDITGQIFGELTVLYKIKDSHPLKWHCKCSCGQETDVYGSCLRQGTTISCGHVKISHGEYFIFHFLKKNNIEFKFNKTMPNLKSPNNGNLRIDFQLLKNNKIICAIEYQGNQHYVEPKDEKWKVFGKYQREVTDKIKKDYFKQQNIPLYEIRYSKRKNTIIKNLIEILIKHDFINGNTVPSLQETA